MSNSQGFSEPMPKNMLFECIDKNIGHGARILEHDGRYILQMLEGDHVVYAWMGSDLRKCSKEFLEALDFGSGVPIGYKIILRAQLDEAVNIIATALEKNREAA